MLRGRRDELQPGPPKGCRKSCTCMPHPNNFEESWSNEDMQKDRDGKVQACPADADKLCL